MPAFSRTFGFRRSIVWRNSPEIDPGNSAYGSTNSGASASAGLMAMPAMSKWSTTTEEGHVNTLRNVHPGDILKEEFLDPLAISAYRLAKETRIPQTRISGIIHQRRRISADTALRPARFFGTTPRFWIGLQNDYDLEEQQNTIAEELEAIRSVG